jgi:hypothetical protein
VVAERGAQTVNPARISYNKILRTVRSSKASDGASRAAMEHREDRKRGGLLSSSSSALVGGRRGVSALGRKERAGEAASYI